MTLSDDQLEAKRTPEQLDAFVTNTFDAIRADEATRTQARMKANNFKVLIEETYPFSAYCLARYKGKNVKCYNVVGNQGYDARIENEDGHLEEVVEITWPIDGQKEYFQRKQLNEKGYTQAEVWDVNDDSKRMAVIGRVLITAQKKALKDYAHPDGSSLLFVLDISPYFGMHEVEHRADIDLLVRKLKDVDFKVGFVWLLLLPIRELIEIKSG